MGINPFPGKAGCNATYDNLVDKNLGQAYTVTRYLYDNFDVLQKNYELLVQLPEAVWTFDPADYATAAQGLKADSAVQPSVMTTAITTAINNLDAQLSVVAKSGQYADLLGKPTLGTAADKDVSFFASAAQGAKADTALQPSILGAANGAATLGADQKIPNAQLPALAITETYVVNSEAAQLALDAQEGDVCVRTDLGKSFIHTNSYVGTMLDWQELLTPTAPVQSVNGQTGTVVLTASNVSAVPYPAGAPVNGQSVYFNGTAWSFYQAPRLSLANTWDAKQTYKLGFIVDPDQLIELGGGGAAMRGNSTGSIVVGAVGTSGPVIFWRPLGNQNPVNQVTISTDGSMNWTGNAAAKMITRRNLGIPATVSAVAPTSPATDDIWIDISTSPMTMKRYNGTAWVT